MGADPEQLTVLSNAFAYYSLSGVHARIWGTFMDSMQAKRWATDAATGAPTNVPFMRRGLVFGAFKDSTCFTG